MYAPFGTIGQGEVSFLGARFDTVPLRHVGCAFYMFQSYLQEKKELLTTGLHEFFKLQKPQAINRWGKDAIERLELFMQNGKMIRGALVFLGYDIISPNASSDILLVAQAAEFFQAGLLIHDDIMDNDELRRGKPSMHKQYTNLMLQENSRYPKNTGKSLALCVGDAAFFFAYQLLNQLNDSKKLIDLFSQELTNVTFAQMQDVYNGASQRKAKLDKILALYQQKTGRYSITLPMMAGAMMAKANKETLRHIEKFGTNLGIVFQLIDDRLNLFGDPKKTGKPIGSDVREGKQTPYFFFLTEKANTMTKDIRIIKQKIIEHGIDKKIADLIQTYTTSAQESIQKIPMTTKQKELMKSFVDYLTHRVK